jgi:hypothetical protein
MLCFIYRFMHHVFGYRGPTLTFLRGQDEVQFCIAADSEWQESHQYWGGEECAVIQILPLYHIIERKYYLFLSGTSWEYYNKLYEGSLDKTMANFLCTCTHKFLFQDKNGIYKSQTKENEVIDHALDHCMRWTENSRLKEAIVGGQNS